MLLLSMLALTGRALADSLLSSNYNASTLPQGQRNATLTSNNNTTTEASSASTTFDLDQCWNSWTSYWGELPTHAIRSSWIASYLYTPTTYTVSSEFTTTVTRASVAPGTSTVTYTVTQIIDNGGFATKTYFRESTYTRTETRSIPASTYTSTSSWAITHRSSLYSEVWSTYSLPSTPSCSLPTTVLSQCDESWNSWVDAQLNPSVIGGSRTSYKSGRFNAAPSCTQASIDDQCCQALKDDFVSGSLPLDQFSEILPDSIGPTGGSDQATIVHWSGGFYSYSTETWAWPSSAFFAPGCTLGCGRCSIIGGTVGLLYWPPATATDATNGTHPITSAVVASEMVTTISGSLTTLTSPTLYVSYRSLYAADACSNQAGKTVFDTIIAIPSDSTLHSIWGMIGGANGYETTDVHTSTTSFNVSDLYQQPVPMSIYSSQPWCGNWARHNLWPFNSSYWECPTDEPYKPIIKIPENLLKSVDPSWEDCMEAFGGFYAIPIALTPADTRAKPTTLTTIASFTTPAQQASTLAPVTVAITSGPQRTEAPIHQ